MARARETYRIYQTGEYLVAAELCRRGLMATPFAGNLPHYDILALEWNGQHIPIQVKTIGPRSSWQFDAQKFVEIRMGEGGRQILGEPQDPPYLGLICVLVQLGESYGKDRFFVLDWKDLRDIIVASYRRGLEKHHGVRPRNPQSTHAAIYPEELAGYKDNWELVLERLQGPSKANH